VIKHCAIIKANADSPRVSKMCLIVIDAFSDIEKRRTVIANKKIFKILIFDDGPPRVKLLYRPAERAVRKEEFASAQTVFLLLYDNVLHPVNADRLFGRALRPRLDLRRPEGSLVGAVLRPTLVRVFGVGQLVMEPANCLAQVNDGGVWERHVEHRQVRCSASPPSYRTT